MDASQQRFHDFLMPLVQPGREGAAEAILTRSFSEQDAGTFALDATVAELMPLIQPQSVAKLHAAAAGMARHGD